MKQTNESDLFQDVRPRKNKQRNEKRTIQIIVCEKSEGSAKTQCPRDFGSPIKIFGGAEHRTS